MSIATHKFRYSNPLTIFSGLGSSAQLSGALANVGATKPHIVTTQSLLQSNALRVLREGSQILASAGVSTVSTHAPSGEIRKIVMELHASGADAVVALGGGSAIDGAKLCAHAAGATKETEISARDLKALLQAPSSAALPIFCLPTTLSAAELYGGAGYTDELTGQKDGAAAPSMLARAVFYDPAFGAETPRALWLSTGIRTLDHAIETLVAASIDPISELLAASAVRDLFDALPQYAADPSSDSVRLRCFVAAWKSYHRPLDAATGLSHTIGKAVGAKNEIPHGITSCVILHQVLRYYYGEPETRASIDRLTALIGMQPAANGDCVVADALESLVFSLGLPTRFSKNQLSNDALRTAAERTAAQKGLPVSDIVKILSSCMSDA